MRRCARGETVAPNHWLVADRQTAGRGRLGREWHDGAGNLMASTAVALQESDPVPHTLALVAALAVFETIASVLPDPRRLELKWPNDVLFGDAKLAGILLERQGDIVIAGIGINLAQAPAVSGRRTASLMELGVHVARDDAAAELAAHFATFLDLWRTVGLARIVDRWMDVGPAPGTQLAVAMPGDERVTGRYKGLGADGSLLLTLADGRERAIYAGEVAVIGAQGDA